MYASVGKDCPRKNVFKGEAVVVSYDDTKNEARRVRMSCLRCGKQKKRPSLRQICVGGGANTKRQSSAVMGSIHGKSVLRQSTTPSSSKSRTLHSVCFPITMLEKIF